MRTDLSSFNTAAQLQKLVCETLLSSAELNALSVEFIPENRQDIDYQIKKNLMQQGLVGICMTPTMNYIGHDGASISYDVKGLTLQIVENVPVNRASNKVSCVTGLDVANYVASYLGGPQAAPGFGIFCPTGIEQGEDNGLIVTKCTFDCTIDGGYGGEFQPISGYHVFNPYVTRDDISSLIQLSIDFNAMSAMVSACISSSMNKADLSTVLSVRDDLIEGIEYVHDEVQDVSSHQRYYLPLSGGTLKSDPDVVQMGGVNLSPSRIQISDGMAGGSSITVNSSKVQLGQVNGPNYPVQEIAEGNYSSFGFVKVNSTGLDVALSAVQERAISSASGHLSVLSDYYTKNETSSSAQISTEIDRLDGRVDAVQEDLLLSTITLEEKKLDGEMVSAFSFLKSFTLKDGETQQNFLELTASFVLTKDAPLAGESRSPRMAGKVVVWHTLNDQLLLKNTGLVSNQLDHYIIPYDERDYSFVENNDILAITMSRGKPYLSWKTSYEVLRDDYYTDAPVIRLTEEQSNMLDAGKAYWSAYRADKNALQNYYTKAQTSSDYELTQKFNKIYEKTQTSSDAELSTEFAKKSDISSLTGYVPYVADLNGQKNAVTIGSRQNNPPVGTWSLVNGTTCVAQGTSSHAEGGSSVASGNFSHAEGYAGNATGPFTHAEGKQTYATEDGAHAEGYQTSATASYAHSEGTQTIASGAWSHAEGGQTSALGFQSHAEGYKTVADFGSSHAEGHETSALAQYSHAEGYRTVANGQWSHADGVRAIVKQEDNHTYAWNGDGDISGYTSHGMGSYNINPVNGISGLYIGEKTLDTILKEAVPEELYNKADAEILSAYTCDKVHTFTQGYAPPTLIASLSVHYVFAKVKNATSCLNEQWRIGGYVTDAKVVDLSAFEEIAGFSLTKDDLVGRVLPYDNLNANYLYRYHKILPFITLAHWTQAPSQNQFYLTFPSQEVTNIEYQWNVENSLSSRKLTARDSAILAASDAICQNYLAMRNFSYEKNQTSSAAELSAAFENNKGVQEVSASVDVLKTELYGADKDMSMVATLKLDRLQEQLNAYSAHLSIEPLSGQPKLSAMAQRTADIYEIYGIPCQPLSSMSALYESVHDIGISTDLSTTFMLSFKQSYFDIVADVTRHDNDIFHLSTYGLATRALIPQNVSDLSNDVGYAKWTGVRQYAYRKTDTSSAVELSSAFANIQLSDVYKKNETSSASELSTAFSTIELSGYVPYQDAVKKAVTVGTRSNGAVGTYSFTAGESNRAGGADEVFGGNGCQVALGKNNVVNGSRAVAIGENNTAWGRNTVAIGRFCNAGAEYSQARGYDSRTNGYYAIADGVNCSAEGNYTMALGLSANTTFGHNGALVWNGAELCTTYNSHGKGTFNVNTENGISGFYIGNDNLANTFATTSSATQIARKEVADFQAQLSTIAPLSADCTMQELLGAVNTIIAALKAQIIHN